MFIITPRNRCSWSMGRCKEYAPIREPILDFTQVYQADIFRQDPALARVQRNGILYEQLIAENRIEDLKKVIRNGVPIDTPTISGDVPITLCALYGNRNAAQVLLKEGADINHPTKYGTPLHVAAQFASVEFVRFLLANGADLNGTNKYEEGTRKGMNALHYAADSGNVDVIPVLIKSGLPVDSTTEKGTTPLMLASYQNRPDAVSALIKYGADVNRSHELDDADGKTKFRFTPLSYAVTSNADRVAQILLKNGADPNMEISKKDSSYPPNERGKPFTIYDLAKESAVEKKNIDVYITLKRRVEGTYGYIDEKGRVIVRPQYDSAYPFSEGLARTAIQVGWERDLHGFLWGYIDRKGQYVIKPQYDYAYDFKVGVALVRRKGAAPLEYIYIDKNGHNICGDTAFMFGDSFSDGIARVVAVPGEPRRFMNLKCDFLSTVKFEDANSFSEGLAAVKVDGKWGYIDTKGNISIEPQFFWAGDFEGGLAQFKIDKLGGALIGFINKKGEVVIEPRFNTAGSFGVGSGKVVLATMGFMDNAVWIDRQGNIVPDKLALAPDPNYKLKPIVKVKGYEGQILDFTEGLAPVRMK